MKAQISSVDQIHDKVQILSILEGIKGVYQELIFEAF